MTAPLPLNFTWEGDCFRPTNAWNAKKADEQYVVGQRYAIVEHLEASSATRAHFFATLRDIWLSFPPALMKEFPSPEALRKHALVREGYADKESLVCSSNAEAKRLAAFIARDDTYAVITVDGRVVTKFTPQSQSAGAMDKKTFQESKDKILSYCASLIGTTAEAAGGNDGQSL